NPIGVMQILNKEETNFDEDDLELLTIMAAQAATAIENARLHEEAKLAVVVNLMGDISHDIKNLITPVSTCTQTLEMMWQPMVDEFNAIQEEYKDSDPALVERIENAWGFIRDFFPEAVEMITDGSTATQERVREIADCVKGIIATPKFELLSMEEVIEKAIKPLKVVGDKNGVTVGMEAGDNVPLTMIDQKQL
ncbi:MAG: hypothetical protein GW802_37230, partial [Armatimonadetes bacterium]|nr:hypothetical protein [Armatimonadota bacterium]